MAEFSTLLLGDGQIGERLLQRIPHRIIYATAATLY